MNRTRILPVVVMGAVLCFCPVARLSADLLTNGDFETVGSNGPNTFHSGTGGVGLSAAANWGVFHQQTNPDATTETNWRTYAELGIPTIDPLQDDASDHVLRVEASHANNGLVQTWAAPGTGVPAINGGVWVWVNGPGQVGVGAGDSGGTMMTKFTTMNNAWEYLAFNESTTPVNEMIIYSSGGSAEFYVDFASVSAVPEPSTIGLLAGSIGLLGLIRVRRR